MTTTITKKSRTVRAALAAATLAIAAGTMALTAPLANADVASDCAKQSGTYAVSNQPRGTVESCTTDHSGNKTTCTYVDGKSQGCVPTPRVGPPTGAVPGGNPPVYDPGTNPPGKPIANPPKGINLGGGSTLGGPPSGLQ